MVTYNIDMVEKECNKCKKITFVAPNGYCLGCTAKMLKSGELKL